MLKSVLYEKKNFAKVSKNFTECRSEDNFFWTLKIIINYKGRSSMTSNVILATKILATNLKVHNYST